MDSLDDPRINNAMKTPMSTSERNENASDRRCAAAFARYSRLEIAVTLAVVECDCVARPRSAAVSKRSSLLLRFTLKGSPLGRFRPYCADSAVRRSDAQTLTSHGGTHIAVWPRSAQLLKPSERSCP